MRTVVFHLLNDYSGSPKVLKGVIEDMLARGRNVDLYTSAGGPLDEIRSPRLRTRHIPYRFKGPAPVKALRFAAAQTLAFLASLRYAFSRDTDFYINTILPVGAALGAALCGKRVTLHCHETRMCRILPYRMLSGMMLRLARKVICVSEFQASLMPAGVNAEIRPNMLTAEFIGKLRPDPEKAFLRRNVLMLSSLKIYKGVREFLTLASLLPRLGFTLVVNDTEENIDAWLKRNGITPSANVSIHPRQADVSGFYNNASVVVNLSNPRLFVETFGMTVLEGAACALPAIVPTVGGVTEMVEDGVNGFRIDCHDTQRLAEALKSLTEDRDLYLRMARAQNRLSDRYFLLNGA